MSMSMFLEPLGGFCLKKIEWTPWSKSMEKKQRVVVRVVIVRAALSTELVFEYCNHVTVTALM